MSSAGNSDTGNVDAVDGAAVNGAAVNGWLRRWYGSGPAHLAAIILGGLVGTYAASKLLEADPWGVALWFLAAALLHDLVLVPAYCGLDRLARRSMAAGGAGPAAVPLWYDHIRVPVLLSGLLLLVFFPLVLGIPSGYEGITGTSIDVYLGRYLGLVAGLFALSGITLVVRLLTRSVMRRQNR